MRFPWRRHLVLPFFVMLGVFFLSPTAGSGNPNAKDTGYHEVTFFVA